MSDKPKVKLILGTPALASRYGVQPLEPVELELNRDLEDALAQGIAWPASGREEKKVVGAVESAALRGAVPKAGPKGAAKG